MTKDTKLNILAIGAGLLIAAILIVYKENAKQSTSPQPNFVIQTSSSDEFTYEQISQALDILKSNCPALFDKAATDIEEAKAFSYKTEYTYFIDAYGWDNLIEVNVQLKNDLNNIPSVYRANGHTLNFYLGSGLQTGIVTDKTQTQRICGWEVSPNGDNMIHITSELNILK